MRSARARAATTPCPELTAGPEASVCRSQEDVADTEHDPGEHFITALLIDVPDHGTQVEMVNCGHPPPLLLHDDQVTVLHARRPVSPLDMGELPDPSHRADAFIFENGVMLLLYTDGFIEARSPKGAFHPLTERAVSPPTSGPEALIRDIHHDLLNRIGHEPGDDAALLVIERYDAHHLHRTPRPTPLRPPSTRLRPKPLPEDPSSALGPCCRDRLADAQRDDKAGSGKYSNNLTTEKEPADRPNEDQRKRES